MIKSKIPCAIIGLLLPAIVNAHGIVGDRYFPPTVAVDDPFAANEIHAIGGRTPNIDIDKVSSITGNVGVFGGSVEPFDGLGISLDGVYRSPNGNLENVGSGFDDIYYRVKQELWTDKSHEFQFSAGVNGQLANSGSKGADNYFNYAPSILFAKGFGDLPEELKYLKPAAVTGVIGYQVPSIRNAPQAINWGFTLQYSLMYLNDHVKTTGWYDFANKLIAVVEFPMQSCMNYTCKNQTVGSVNPGIVWVGSHYNIATELVVPTNANSGSGMGFLVQYQQFFGK
jgi:hypothetical protein